MTSSDRSGTEIGRYRLVRLLGRGGMGEVYEALDTDKGRTVALKLLPPALSDDAGFRARFLRESQAVAKLNDPHIIPIHDFGELDGQLFLDMRIVHGRDLRSVVAAGPLSAQRAVAVVEQIASALDTAHATGLLHRDVKPENVLLDARDFAYLADFGLAQSAGQTRLTSTGTAIGSFAYMAPERFGTDTAVGPAADVYALACVLYECLTGAQPYPSTSIEQIIAGHLSRPVPTTGTPFDAVLAAGLAKEAAARIQSAGAFAAAAREVLSGRHPHLPGPASTPTAVAPPNSIPPNSIPPNLMSPTAGYSGEQYPVSGRPGAGDEMSMPVRPARSRTGVIAAAVAAVILLAGGAIAWMLIGDSGGPATVAEVSAAAPAPVTVTMTQPPSHEPPTAGAAPTETTAIASAPTASTQQQTPTGRGSGDLGLAVPITRPACDGQTVTFVYNAVTPGNYESEIAAALTQYPGASYLRTDAACDSLKQSENGSPIYAVYYPGSSLAETCSTKARVGGGAYARRLDDVTPVGTEVC